MKRPLIFLYLASVFLASGCASIVGDDSQPVSIDTPACPGASCRLTNSQGTYIVKSTPETVVINKAYSDLTVTCEKGDEISTSVHQSSANGATFGNILLGGIPGALVDGGSGAGYDYQSYLVNNLKCSASTTVSPAATNTTMKSVYRQPNKTVEERLLELKQLLEKGLISEDDAAIHRRKILGSM
jgi:hypothetical protein